MATTLVFAEQVADDTVDEDEEEDAEAEADAELLPLPTAPTEAVAAADMLGASLPLALLELRVVVVCLRSDCSIICK